MRAYRRLQALLGSTFIAYLVLAVSAELVFGAKDAAFPVSSWALFEKVPNRITRYAVRIRVLDGKEIEPGRQLFEMGELLPEVNPSQAHAAVESLGAALTAADEGKIASARRVFEERCLHGRRARYEIAARTYADPRDGWYGRAPVEVRSLSAFETIGGGG